MSQRSIPTKLSERRCVSIGCVCGADCPMRLEIEIYPKTTASDQGTVLVRMVGLEGPVGTVDLDPETTGVLLVSLGPFAVLSSQ